MRFGKRPKLSPAALQAWRKFLDNCLDNPAYRIPEPYNSELDSYFARLERYELKRLKKIIGR